VQHFNMTAAVAGYTLPDLMQKMLDRSIHKMTEALVTNIFVHQVQEHKHTIVEVVRNAQRA
jgi:hypothetical protein